MKVLNNKNKLVIVFSGTTNGCPRMIVAGSSCARLRDDYRHSISLNRGMLKKIVSG